MNADFIIFLTPNAEPINNSIPAPPSIGIPTGSPTGGSPPPGPPPGPEGCANKLVSVHPKKQLPQKKIVEKRKNIEK